MTKFIVRTTQSGRFLSYTGDGRPITGTPHRHQESAEAEIAGYAKGWNEAHSPKLIGSWNINWEQTV